MSKKIVIFGAGDQAKVLACEILKKKDHKIAFFVDKFASEKKKKIFGYKVISFDDLKRNINQFNFGIIGIGDLDKRKKILSQVNKAFKKFNWLSIISNKTFVDESVKIGEGTFVMKGSIINLNSKIGKHCLINTASIIEHDCRLGNFVNCSPRSLLLGNVKIDDGSFIGANSTIIENMHVEKNVKIGANSLVNKTCKSNSLYFGSPIKKIKNL